MVYYTDREISQANPAPLFRQHRTQKYASIPEENGAGRKQYRIFCGDLINGM